MLQAREPRLESVPQTPLSHQRNCPNCGASLVGGTLRCDYCGVDWEAPGPAVPVRLRPDKQAVRCFAYAALGLFFVFVYGLGILLVMISIVVGARTWGRINADPARIGGRNYCIAGFVVDGVASLLFFMIWIFPFLWVAYLGARDYLQMTGW